MLQRIIDIKTDSLSVFNKDARSLLLCLEDFNITIAMVDKVSKEWVAVEVWQWNEEDADDAPDLLEQLQQQSALLHYTGLATKILVRTLSVTPIPTDLAAQATQLLQAQFGLSNRDMVIVEQVNNHITVALKAEAEWIGAFTKIFPEATLHSTLAWLVKQALYQSRNNALPILQTVFTNGLVELAFVKHNQLLVAKCFSFNTLEDMNYELLNMCQQLHVSPAELAVRMQGFVIEESALHQSLLKYFGDVQFAVADTSSWGVAFKTIPNHYFTALI